MSVFMKKALPHSNGVSMGHIVYHGGHNDCGLGFCVLAPDVGLRNLVKADWQDRTSLFVYETRNNHSREAMCLI